jgi:hypothetical protein
MTRLPAVATKPQTSSVPGQRHVPNPPNARLDSGLAGKSYTCPKPQNWQTKSVGNGQCVAFVQQAAGVPNTSQWKEGQKVRGSTIAKGTAIATFQGGVYPNKKTGNHAAIYDGQDKNGIWVWDQWKSKTATHLVQRRYIPFRGGKGSPSNDGDAFSVIAKR